MAYFIALGILSLVGIVGTVWLVRTDGYGRTPPTRRALDPLDPLAGDDSGRSARSRTPEHARHPAVGLAGDCSAAHRGDG